MGCLLLGGASSFSFAQEAPEETPIPAKSNRITPLVSAVYKTLPSTVSIHAERAEYPIIQAVMNRTVLWPFNEPNTDSLMGSGFFVSKQGHILTCAHILDHAASTRVTCSNNEEYKAKIIAMDRQMDIALIKIDPPENYKIQPIPMATQSDVLLGETVVTVGNPLGYHGTISTGIVSGLSRRLISQTQDEMMNDLIQINISTHNGSSGSPVVNMDGELMGMMVLKYKSGDNIGFALSVENMGNFMAHYAFAHDALPYYDWGVQFKNTQNEYWEVAKFYKNSPFIGKLNPTDSILSINNIEIKDWPQLVQNMWSISTDTLSLKIQTVQNESIELQIPRTEPRSNEQALKDKFGISAMNLSRALSLATRLNRVNGALITSTRTEEGLRRGDLVVFADHIPIDTAETLAKVLANVPVGGKINLGVIFHDPSLKNPTLISYRTVEITAHE